MPDKPISPLRQRMRLRRSKASKIARLTRSWVGKNKARRLRPYGRARILCQRETGQDRPMTGVVGVQEDRKVEEVGNERDLLAVARQPVQEQAR